MCVYRYIHIYIYIYIYIYANTHKSDATAPFLERCPMRLSNSILEFPITKTTELSVKTRSCT